MTYCPLRGRGQSHVSNFYTVDFPTVSRRCRPTGVINELVDSQLVDYTYTAVKRVVAECTSLLYVGRL